MAKMDLRQIPQNVECLDVDLIPLIPIIPTNSSDVDLIPPASLFFQILSVIWVQQIASFFARSASAVAKAMADRLECASASGGLTAHFGAGSYESGVKPPHFRVRPPANKAHWFFDSFQST